jgi:hypothetical protein
VKLATSFKSVAVGVALYMMHLHIGGKVVSKVETGESLKSALF